MFRVSHPDLRPLLGEAAYPSRVTATRENGAPTNTSANGLEPYAYLNYIFEHLPDADTVEALEALLPWNVTPLLNAQRLRS